MSSLLELVNEVLRRTGQVQITTLVNAQTPATQTRDFLNETYFEMLHRLKVNRLIKSATITTSNGTSAYSLAADAEINGLLADSVLENSGQVHLREVDYTYPLAQGTTATGKPEVFYRQGNQLKLYPIPDAAYTLQYSYLAKPVKLSVNADTTALPVEWESVLVLGTQARLEKFLGEPADESYLLYRDGLVQLRSRAPLKPEHRMRGNYLGGQS